MKAPLYNRLINYSKENLAFHMPGHKFGVGADLNKIDITKLDNTEAIGMDNLYEAEGIIAQAMELMAAFYGSQKSVFLTNGSTAGILTSIMAICKEGDKLIVARNSHHSVWSALVLVGIYPIYVNPEVIGSDILGQIKKETIEKAIVENPDAKGVIIVSPTYEGIVSDITGIAEIVHQYNKILIVDEAHGAHFVLENGFPRSAVIQGADLVINSMHKTLPALTQSALLHICSNRVSYEDIITNLRMIQTSSPSYAMMGIMDYVRDYIIKNKDIINETYISKLKQIRKELSEELKHLSLIEYQSQYYDISKVIISTQNTNINGYELVDILYREYNITIEAALEKYIIVITTMADNESTLSIMKKALVEIDRKIDYRESRSIYNVNLLTSFEITIGKKTRDIYYSSNEWIAVNKCIGRIAAKNVMIYPPGIPIICIGEEIREEQIKIINKDYHKIQGVKINSEYIALNVMR